jgi:hypothetical protein
VRGYFFAVTCNTNLSYGDVWNDQQVLIRIMDAKIRTRQLRFVRRFNDDSKNWPLAFRSDLILDCGS